MRCLVIRPLLLVVAVASCFNPTPNEGVPCSEDGECPSGQGCDLISFTCSINPRIGCLAQEELCDGACVDTESDIGHCGGCGQGCLEGQVCGNAECADSCPVETLECDSSCIDPQTDDDHCGGCNNACDADRECRDGSCELRCDTFLEAPIQDSWGAYWDGLPRTAASFPESEADCASFGGRLPTATELYRVSTAHTSDVGDSIHTEWLWTLVPYDAVSQVIARLSDGTISQANATSTDHEYRCTCPETRPESFRGSSCYGDPGADCFALASEGGRYNIDPSDRPAMRKSSAVWECAFDGGHLAGYRQIVEGIRTGLSGSNEWLNIADDVRNDLGGLIRWTGDGASWVASGNISYTGLPTVRAFRCAGASYLGGSYSQTPGAEFVGKTYKSDSQDSASVDLVVAHDACFASGGHLPRMTELVELVHQGLPAGSDEFLWTSDEVGYNGTNFLMALIKWSGVNNRLDYSYSGNMTWGYRTNSYPYRCIYYPADTDYLGPATEDCVGGCTEVAVPGSDGKMWFDTTDREFAALEDAYDGCRISGGRLPSQRDLHEAIRQGLPNGATQWLWVDDMTMGNQSSPLQKIVKWTDVDLDFDGHWSTYSTWSWPYEAPDGANPRVYRCMWTNELR